jgi:cytochrome d ubiquinol oxidase subunit II
MFAMHGAIFLTMKTDGELNARIRKAIPRLTIAFFVLNTLVVIGTIVFRDEITRRYLTEIWPVIFPALALGALIVSWVMRRIGHDFWSFVASGAMIALLLISGAIGMFPNLLISTIDPRFNLTIYNAASADNTLTVMLVIALIGMPLVLLYTAGVYYFFRGKVVVEPKSY